MTPAENDMDLRARTVALERQYGALDGRTTELEKWQRKSEVDDARQDVRFSEMDKKLNAINSNLSRLMWIVIAGIMAGIVSFMMNGGFARVQEKAEILLDSTRPIMPASRPLICPSDRPVLVRSYCRGPSQSPWLGEAVLRTR